MKTIILENNEYLNVDIDTEITYRNKTYVVKKIDEITENVFMLYVEELEIKKFGKDRL